MIFLPLIIIGIIIWLLLSPGSRERFKSTFSNKERHDPLDIAKARYAKGEITREEYERIKKDLV